MSALAAVALAVQAVTSTSEVRACRLLADGGVLAATSGGVVLYSRDLAVQRVWTALDGLPGTDAHALLGSDGGDRVWVGTSGGAAALQLADGRVSSTAAVGDVRALAWHDGRVVAGTWGRGVVVLDAATGGVVARSAAASPEAKQITALASAKGRTYVGTAGAGLFEWNGTTLRSLPDVATPGGYVTAVASGEHQVLVATLAGVVGLDEGAPLSSVEARALVWLGSAGWWAGTMGEGLQRLDLAQRDALPAAVVTALGAAGDTLCAGTDDGLYVRRGASAWTRAETAGPPSNDVSALAWDGTRLWAGTFDRGLAVWDGGRFRTVEGLDARVNALAVERTESGTRVWVATARGLATVEEGVVRVLRRADGLPDDDVHAVAPLAAGGVVAGTTRGAVVVRDGRVRPAGPKRMPAHATWAVAEAEDGALWLGTTAGLFRVSGDRFRRFSAAGGALPDDWVTALASDAKGVWVGTYAGGAARVAADARGRIVGTTVLASVHVNPAGLALHDGRVSVATMEGLFVGEGNGFRATPGAAPGGDVTAVVHADGVRWVASRNGLGRSR